MIFPNNTCEKQRAEFKAIRAKKNCYFMRGKIQSYFLSFGMGKDLNSWLSIKKEFKMNRRKILSFKKNYGNPFSTLYRSLP